MSVFPICTIKLKHNFNFKLQTLLERKLKYRYYYICKQTSVLMFGINF